MTTHPGALFEHLTRLDRIEHRAGKGTLHTLLPELDAAVEALGMDPRAAVLLALRRALRIDLAFLVQYPEATFSCLYNRCIWHEAPEEDAYHDPPEISVARAPDNPLHALMKRWRAEKAVEGAPWPRSLRPPEVSLHGALVEEYRAESPQLFQQLLITEGGSRVALLHRPDDPQVKDPATPKVWSRIVWDRVTGRRIEGASVVGAGEETSLDGKLRVHANSWGDVDLVDCATGVVIGPLPLDEYRNCGSVAFTPDNRLVAIAGWDEDGYGFFVVYDVTTRAPVCDVNLPFAAFGLAISPRGDRLAASGSSSTSVHEIPSGRELHALSLSHAVPAFTPDGRRLVTAELGVVRLWDLDRPIVFLRGCRGGITSATFSPDGTRLLTGTLLVDARTGGVIAHLDFEHPQNLAGGPPEDAFVVGDTRIVSLQRGIDVWDARTGATLVKKQEPRYFLQHIVTLTRDGRRYAVVRRSDDESAYMTVDVFDTDSGATLAEITTSNVTSMAWSPDGPALATGSCDGTVRFWDVAHGRLLWSMPDHEGSVAGMAILRRRPPDSLPWTIEMRAGSLVIVSLSTLAEVGWIPANESLVQHPTEAVWAGGRVHFRLE